MFEINRHEYPFESRYVDLPMGRMHYIDVGQGETIVLVHGNPSWSFVYRNIVKSLSGQYRCVAFDHIGFGLSDKPYDWSYRPADHAENLRTAIERLALQNITLVVQDWGGPIGLSYAVTHPQNVARILIMNTWMWSVKNDWYYWGFSKFMGGPIGRYLIRHHNFFARTVVRAVTGDKSKLPPDIHRHYTEALSTPQDRKGSWVFPAQITASDAWLAELWSRRSNLVDKPAAIAWGMKDIAFREKELKTWMALLPNASVYRFEDAGHFVQDEKSAELTAILRQLMQKTKSQFVDSRLPQSSL